MTLTARELEILTDALTGYTGNPRETGALSAKLLKMWQQAEIAEHPRAYESITAAQTAVNDIISIKISDDGTIEQGTVSSVYPSRDGHKDPVILAIRRNDGSVRHRKFAPQHPVRRYL